MNMTLVQLSYRNIKKYKKHYLIVSILIFLISTFFISYPTIWDNQYLALKKYNQQTYGEWYYLGYVKMENGEEVLDDKKLTQYIYDANEDYKAYYEYVQGSYNDYVIARADDELFDFCKMTINGRKIANDHEILISSLLSKNENLSLNDTLKLTINNQTNIYTIVGVTDNPQPQYFSDIYTNIQEFNSLKVYSNTDLYMVFNPLFVKESYRFEDYITNHKGYDVTNRNNTDAAHYDLNSLDVQEVIVLIETLVLTGFALISLTSSSLKRRSKELALLRGIGMTTKQMLVTVLYEMLLSSFPAIILGMVASLLIAYQNAVMYSKETCFVFMINPLKMAGYATLLLGFIIISCLYPIYSSASQSLTGTFDGEKFKKIDIRYRKLKKQSLAYIALREMKSYKKMTISLFIILGFFASYIAIMIDNHYIPNEMIFKSFHYIELDFDSWNTEYNKVRQIASSTELDSTIIPYFYFYDDNEFKYIGFTDLDTLKNCVITGELPANSNEILINRDGEINCKINDVLHIEGIDYKVVGFIEKNESVNNKNLYYLPTSVDGYIMNDMVSDYEREVYDMILTDVYYKLRIYYDDLEQKQEILKVLSDYDIHMYYDSDNGKVDVSYALAKVNPLAIILPSLICLVFCYFLNQNHMLNNAKDFALLRLIGLTKKGMLIKQIYKSIFISLMAILILIFTLLSLQNINKALILIFLLMLFIVIASFIIYCLPLVNIIGKQPMEIFDRNE